MTEQSEKQHGSLPDWYVVPIPVEAEPTPPIAQTEQQFQRIYDEMQRVLSDNPDEIAHFFLVNKDIRELPKPEQNELFAIFVQPTIDAIQALEDSTRESRREEVLRETGIFSAHAANAIVRGTSLKPRAPVTPQLPRKRWSRRGGRSFGEPGDSFFDNPVGDIPDDVGDRIVS
jgi:hypothetical protein